MEEASNGLENTEKKIKKSLNDYLKPLLEINGISSFNTDIQCHPHILEFHKFSLKSNALAEINLFLNLIKNESNTYESQTSLEPLEAKQKQAKLELCEPIDTVNNHEKVDEIKAISWMKPSYQQNPQSLETLEGTCLFQNKSDPNVEKLIYECSEQSLPNFHQLKKQPNNAKDNEINVIKFFGASVSSASVSEANDFKSVNNFIFFDSYTEINGSIYKSEDRRDVKQDRGISVSANDDIKPICEGSVETGNTKNTQTNLPDEIKIGCSEMKDSYTEIDRPGAENENNVVMKTLNMLYQVLVGKDNNRIEKDVPYYSEYVKNEENLDQKTKLVDRSTGTENKREIKINNGRTMKNRKRSKSNDPPSASPTEYYDLKITKHLIDKFPNQILEIYESNCVDGENYSSVGSETEDMPNRRLKRNGILKESFEELTSKKQNMILKDEQIFNAVSGNKDVYESTIIDSTSHRSSNTFDSYGSSVLSDSGVDRKNNSTKYNDGMKRNSAKNTKKYNSSQKLSSTSVSTVTDNVNCKTRKRIESKISSNKIHLDNGEPVILFNKCGYPLTDLKGRKLKNNLGTELLPINSYKELINSKLQVYDCYNVCVNEKDFHPVKGIHFQESGIQILGDGDQPVKLYNSLGYPLNDEDGHLLCDSRGLLLVILDSTGAPICCTNSEPVYVEDGSLWITVRDKCYVIHYGKTKSINVNGNNELVHAENKEVDREKKSKQINLPENGIQVLTFNDKPIRLYNSSGYPLTDLDGFLLKDPHGKLLVILDSSGAPMCCTNSEPIYVEDGSLWVTVRDNYKVIHYGKRNLAKNNNNTNYFRKITLPEENFRNTNPLLSLVEKKNNYSKIGSFPTQINGKFEEYNSALYLNAENGYPYKNDVEQLTDENMNISEISQYNLLGHDKETQDYNYLRFTTGMEIMLPNTDQITRRVQERNLKVWSLNSSSDSTKHTTENLNIYRGIHYQTNQPPPQITYNVNTPNVSEIAATSRLPHQKYLARNIYNPASKSFF